MSNRVPTRPTTIRETAPGVVRERTVHRAYDERGTLRAEAAREVLLTSGLAVPPAMRQLPRHVAHRSLWDKLGDWALWVTLLTLVPLLAIGGASLAEKLWPAFPLAAALGYLFVLTIAYLILT